MTKIELQKILNESSQKIADAFSDEQYQDNLISRFSDENGNISSPAQTVLAIEESIKYSKIMIYDALTAIMTFED